MADSQGAHSRWLSLAGGATIAMTAVLATGALAATPTPGGDYENARNLDSIVVAKDASGGYFTVTPRRCNEGLSIPGDKRAKISATGALAYNGYGRVNEEVRGRLRTVYAKLVIRGQFTNSTTLKWKSTITLGRCKEKLSSTLKLTRIALK